MSPARMLVAAAAAATLPMAAMPAAFAEEGSTYTAQLSPLNDSGASGTASVTDLGNGQVRVDISSSGLLAGNPHAQHIHFAVDSAGECPTVGGADTNGDGFISTPEGIPAYGAVKVSLTTTGDVSDGSALAVERFPVGDAVTYSRTFDLPAGYDASNLANSVIVQHGIDVNGNGKYDMDAEIGASPLDKKLPAEATFPAACGAVSPASGMSTGAGGTAVAEDGAGLLGLGGGLLVGAGALLMLWRRNTAEV